MAIEPLTRFQKIDITFKILTAVGVLAAIVGLCLTYLTLRENHEWNRRQFTLVILGSFKKDVGQTQEILNASFPGLYLKDKSAPMTREQAVLYYNATKDKPEDFKIRAAIIDRLNYLEYVCTAYESYTVDRDIVKEVYSGIFKRSYAYFREFMVVAREQEGDKPYSGAWAPVDRVVNSWLKEVGPSERLLRPTGS
jgi:Domain of unknown function (DUF4760)